MLAIKLKRIGKKHQSAFRIVVSEKRSKVGGRYVEDLGFWNPRENKHDVNKERVEYWIKSGAQPSNTVHNLLVKSQAIKGHKISVHKVVEKTVEQPVAEQPVVETQVSEPAVEVNQEAQQEAVPEVVVETVSETPVEPQA